MTQPKLCFGKCNNRHFCLFDNHHFHPPTDWTDLQHALGMEFDLTDNHDALHSPPFPPSSHVYPVTYDFP